MVFVPAKEGSLANCFLVALLGFIEVNDVPNSVKVIGLDVEVLEVESVFPDIDTDNRDVAQERILVGSGNDLELVVRRVYTEPTPS